MPPPGSIRQQQNAAAIVYRDASLPVRRRRGDIGRHYHPPHYPLWGRAGPDSSRAVSEGGGGMPEISIMSAEGRRGTRLISTSLIILGHVKRTRLEGELLGPVVSIRRSSWTLKTDAGRDLRRTALQRYVRPDSST